MGTIPDLVLSLNLQLEVMKAISRRISRNATTNKTTGGRYPIRTGYSNSVRRPMGETAQWMKVMETTLEMIIENLEKSS